MSILKVSIVIGFILALIITIPLALWLLIEVPQYKSTCIDYGHRTNREVVVSQPNWGTVACYVHMPNGWFDLDQINQQNIAQ